MKKNGGGRAQLQGPGGSGGQWGGRDVKTITYKYRVMILFKAGLQGQ